MPANTLSPDAGDKGFQDNAEVRQRYRHDETVDTATGDWLILPAGIGELLASVTPAAGTARVEYTQASITEVEAGTATGVAWDSGDVSSYTASVMSNSVTAIRCVASASCQFTVTA